MNGISVLIKDKRELAASLSTLCQRADTRRRQSWDAWVAQPVKHPTSAQVMITWSVSSSPKSGSVLTAQSLEPVSDSVSPSLSDPPLFMLCLSLSQKEINIKKKKKEVVNRPESRSTPDTGSAGDLILDCPASKHMRSKCFLSTLSSLW